MAGYGKRKLYIVNVSDPTAPVELGLYDTPGDARGLKAVGDYLFIADGMSGLGVVDVSDPAFPYEVGSFDSPGNGQNVDVAGEYAYLADGEGGFVVLRLLKDSVVGSIFTTGGTLSSTNNDTQLSFPSGAFAETTLLTYRQLWVDRDTGELAGIGHIFDLTAVYSATGQIAQLEPGKTYTVTTHYSGVNIGPANESTLALYYWDGSDWIRETTSTLDTTNKTVTATPNRFSQWAILAETYRVYLPNILRN